MRVSKPLVVIATGFAVMGLSAGYAQAKLARPDIPSNVRVLLRTEALRVARLDGDRHPYDMEAVRTTIEEADRLTCGPGCHTYIPPPSTPVYLLAMRGHFSCNNCSPPAGARIGPGTVITLEIPVAAPSGYSGFGFADKYPNLNAAGVPAHLSARR
jgi:hypothetical protein